MDSVLLSKRGAIEKQLEAAIYLSLRDFHPAPIHTLIGAVRGLLRGLQIENSNAVLDWWDEQVFKPLVPGDQKLAKRLENEAANFLKHSDRDPEGEIPIEDLRFLNQKELLLCILAALAAGVEFGARLRIGIMFAGLNGQEYLNLRGFLSTIGALSAGASDVSVETFFALDDFDRRTALLDLFENS